jgi:hypothetical protein
VEGGEVSKPFRIINRKESAIDVPIAWEIKKDDFPWMVMAPAPPFAFGKLVALLTHEAKDLAPLFKYAPECLDRLKLEHAIANSYKPISCNPSECITCVLIARAEGRS